jgi:hypothetical protein
MPRQATSHTLGRDDDLLNLAIVEPGRTSRLDEMHTAIDDRYRVDLNIRRSRRGFSVDATHAGLILSTIHAAKMRQQWL